MKQRKTKRTCVECAYSTPAQGKYSKDFVRCHEKESDFGKTHKTVYVSKTVTCNIFK